MDQWFVLLWLAIVVSFGAYSVILTLLRHLSAMRVASLSYLVPPVTMIQAYFVFEDAISMTDIVGLIVAAVGVYFVMTHRSAKTVLTVQPRTPDEVAEQRSDRIQKIEKTRQDDLLTLIMARGGKLDIEL